MFTTKIKNIELTFETANELFSPRVVDPGTLALLSVIEFEKNDKICDLGCGYGVIGILAAKLTSENVVMIDNDELAIKIAKKNAQRNGVDAIKIILSDGFTTVHERGFTKIITNPPYHVDFLVPKAFIEKGFNRLQLNGEMYMVTKRRTWYEKKLQSIFGNVVVFERDGYYVFKATKRQLQYANKTKEKHKTPPKKRRRK